MSLSGGYRVLRDQALFRLGGGDAETAHERTLGALARFGTIPTAVAAGRRWALGDAPGLPRTLFGVPFPGPVGLAAGMDKNGVALPAWAGLGFGFVEVGTVTAHAQPGNPQPRLFRLPASEAIVNRMGFNNRGAAALAARLADLCGANDGRPLPIPVGVSLGKSKVTPLDAAVEDYRTSLRLVHRYADYVAVNVSSPNTPGLRALQDRAALDELLGALTTEAAGLRTTPGPRRPVGRPAPLVVKIAPDLTDAAVGEVLEVCAAHGVAGVIVSNTTLDRSGVAAADTANAAETGGLSGRPLSRRARELVRFVVRESTGRMPVIGVGGILTAADATAMFDSGAALVQVYTGLVYRGPGLVRAINKSVTQRCLGRSDSAEGISGPLRARQGDSRGAVQGRVTNDGSSALSRHVAREVSE